MNVAKNPKDKSTHSVILTWDDPTNIQQAAEGSNDKDIQYQLDICTYNRYEPTKREGCKTYAKMLRTKGTNQQTTESGMNVKFYKFNFHPDQKKELLYILTPFALNGTKGEAGELIKRIDDTKSKCLPCFLSILSTLFLFKFSKSLTSTCFCTTGTDGSLYLHNLNSLCIYQLTSTEDRSTGSRQMRLV